MQNHLVKVNVFFHDPGDFVNLLYGAAGVGDKEDAGINLTAVFEQHFYILPDSSVHVSRLDPPQLQPVFGHGKNGMEV